MVDLELEALGADEQGAVAEHLGDLEGRADVERKVRDLGALLHQRRAGGGGDGDGGRPEDRATVEQGEVDLLLGGRLGGLDRDGLLGLGRLGGLGGLFLHLRHRLGGLFHDLDRSRLNGRRLRPGAVIWTVAEGDREGREEDQQRDGADDGAEQEDQEAAEECEHGRERKGIRIRP